MSLRKLLAPVFLSADSIDPVAIAAELVLSLQTIVSRENKPTEPTIRTGVRAMTAAVLELLKK